MKKLLTALALLLVSSHANAQKMPWEEYGKQIQSRGAITAHGPQIFGDDVALYSGGLSFSATDISLPGNHGLPVALTRKTAISDRYDHANDMPFADWDIDIPKIEGVYATTWQNQRCSSYNLPPTIQLAGGVPNSGDVTVISYGPVDYWQGNQAQMPGGGELLKADQAAVPNPSTGGPYKWVTSGMTYFSCLPSIANGPGEGFLAITTDGTTYRFDHMAQFYEPDLGSPLTKFQWTTPLPRRRNALYVTRVEDRHGNYVAYEYANQYNQPVKLTRIRSGDGRQIDLTYGANGRVSSATNGSRTWNYAYGVSSTGQPTLSSVTLPDTSRWQINFSALANVDIEMSSDDGPGVCGNPGIVLGGVGAGSPGKTGSIVHPSGATAEFEVKVYRFGRTNVPRYCINWSTIERPGDEVAVVPRLWNSIALARKTVTGPGVVPATWTYDYQSGRSWINDSTVSCQTDDCMVPVCLTGDCAGRTRVVVTGPGGEWKRYQFGNSYHYDEGKLLLVETGTDATNILRTETMEYALGAPGQPYPRKIGTSLQERGSYFTGAYPRPQKTKTIALDGATFTSQVAGFDDFLRPTSVVRSSSLGYSRTDTTTYLDDREKWVVGLPTRTTTTGPDGTVVNDRTEYDPASLLPVRFYGAGTQQVPGLLLQTLTYDAGGVVTSVKDGNNNLTTLSNWYRGVPRGILHADGATESAEVNAQGWITAITNAAGFTSNYQYDAMGRLARVIHPAGDSTAWNDTIQSFVQVAAEEYGIPAGHWKQTIVTGNARKLTYYDAMWRPLVVREYDTANPTATSRFQRYAYDDSGRTVFASFPAATSNPGVGTWSEYDVLGRVTSVATDSEFGSPIVTLTEYLPGFKTKVTNGRLHHTTTSYMAWDQPSTDLPVAIVHPEGAFTDIARDMLGKPKALVRRNASGSVQVSRNYVYDYHQRLCKTLEPETGATVTSYDPAGNIAWTKSGAALPSLTSCDTNAVAQADRTVRTYDARNRVLTLSFPDGRGNTTYDYTPDGLLEQLTVANGGTVGTVLTSYAYNRRRLPTAEVAVVGSHQWPTAYGYDANGFVALHNLPGGLSVSYLPNALGQATQAGTFATGATYYPNGALKQFTYGNGIVHTLTQNVRGLPERSRDAYLSEAVHDDTMDYDFNGNVAAITDGLVGARGNRTMTYDALDRLTSTTSPMFGTATYSYDVLDNLKGVQVTGGPKARHQTYVYDSSNRLTTTLNTPTGGTVASIAYDAQGNLSNKNGVGYDFDFGNRLRSVAGTANEQYGYDGHGRRVRAIRNGASIYSVYGQDGVLRFQRDERVGKSTQYVHLAGSLVAQVEDGIPLSTPAISAPGFSATGKYTVSWTATAVATHYQLQEQIHTGSWVTVYDGPELSRTFIGREPDNYGYRVRACSATACGSLSSVVVVQVQLPPNTAPVASAPPIGLNGGFTLTWTTAAAASTYEVQERQGAGAWASIQTVAGTSAVISGRDEGPWSYQVRGCNGAGCGPFSAIVTVNMVAPPTATSTLTAPAASYTGSYSLSWTAVASATRYELDERLGSGSWANVHNAAATSKALSGRVAGSWSYRVRGCNDAGCAPYSAVQTTLVTLPPVAAPSLTTPAANYTGSYPVTWTAVGAATSYLLEQQLNGGGWTQVQAAAATSRAVSGQASGSYGYRVRGCNVGGCGPYSAVGTTQVTLPPASAPSPTAPASSSTGDFTVSWNAVAAATSYQIDEQVNGGAWTALALSPATALSKNIAGKPPGTYGYRVRACNIGGCSASSATASVTVALALGTPSLGGETNTTSDSPFTINWTAVSGAATYELQQSRNGGGWSTVYTGTLRSRTVQMGPATYAYRVRACSASGCGGYSNIHTVSVARSIAMRVLQRKEFM